MQVRGRCVQTNEKGDYVVKLRAGTQMWAGSFLNELVCSLIAKELDLFVPEPAIVEISQELVDLMIGHQNYSIARSSIGQNFGSEYHEGFSLLVPDSNFSDVLRPQLAELLAFDIFIGNPDRRLQKPNFLTNGSSLLILDHEMACSFTLTIGANASPWIITDLDVNWISEHYCYPIFHGEILDLHNFRDKLALINNGFWNKLEAAIPAGWVHDSFGRIKNQLDQIVQHRDIFVDEINRILHE